MIRIVASGVVRDGCRTEFLRLAERLGFERIAFLPEADFGGRVADMYYYGLYASADAPERVAFLEEWKDEAAVEAHNATPHFTEICPALGAFLKEPMQVTTYTQVL